MWLTRGVDYGLIRPVARIAQSVEQGIENPRVLGSIPSPAPLFRKPSLWLGFCYMATADFWALISVALMQARLR